MEDKAGQRQDEDTITPIKPSFEGVTVSSANGDAPSHDLPHEAASGVGRWLLGAGALVLVVAILGSFFVLPRLVQQDNAGAQATQSAVAAPVPSQPQPAAPQLTAQEREQLSKQTESLLAQLLTQQKQLKDISAASWGGDAWTRYMKTSTAGDNAYVAEAYQEAIDGYGQALEIGKTLLARSASVTQQALAAGQQALAAGEADLAAQQFALVLKVEPHNEAAKAGQARAESLPRVLALSRQGDALRADGKLEAAKKTYREAVALDPDWKPSANALAAVESTLANQKFTSLMSKGYEALSAQDYTTAEQHFRAALVLHPTSDLARDGLAQAHQGTALGEIALARVRAKAFEVRELWDRAIEQYQAALAVDGTLEFAHKGLEHARARAALEAKLQNLIDHPELLYGDQILAGAKQLLAQARAIADPGQRLDGQITKLASLVGLATTPVTVELRSDGKTKVTVYRVGQLGMFATKELELRPGRYTAVGSRVGYRDVRKIFDVLPGQPPDPVSVICVEPI